MMRASRYAASRQKACQPCSAAKARCDRNPVTCGRCALRGHTCTYSQPARSPASPASSRDLLVVGTEPSGSPVDDLSSSLGHGPAERIQAPSPGVPVVDTLLGEGSPVTVSSTTAVDHVPEREPRPADSMCLELTCPINFDDIRNRWLNTYIPFPEQRPKNYPPSVTGFVFRVLKSYASVVVRGRGVPPFLHGSQVAAESVAPPISTCLSLVRICDKSLPGSEEVATDVLKREMNSLYENHGTCDDMSLIAAFQAYLIYAMVLFFWLNRSPDAFFRQAIINLQELACASARGGLVCVAEQQRARPKWETWVVAEAKRRTLYTMYFFDNVLSAHDGQPTFIGSELGGLPAPGSKFLWHAASQHDWETAYNSHLAEWPDGDLHIDELWPIPAEMTAVGVTARRGRVDRWLEDVDEFGTMLYAVTSCTYGG